MARHPRRILSVGALVAIAMSVSSASAQPAVRYRALGETKAFPRLRQEMQRIVNNESRTNANTFCVMLAGGGEGARNAFAIWKERDLLYRWDPPYEGSVTDAVLILHEPLDLKRDVIRTRADRTSTYKVTTAWVRDVKAQCERVGREVKLTQGKR